MPPAEVVCARWRARGRGLVGRQRDASEVFGANHLRTDRRMKVLPIGDQSHRHAPVEQQRERDPRPPVVYGGHRIVDVGTEADPRCDRTHSLIEIGAGMTGADDHARPRQAADRVQRTGQLGRKRDEPRPAKGTASTRMGSFEWSSRTEA